MNGGDNGSGFQDRWVKLNVGGTIFLTTRTTLARYPGSFLHRLCQEDSGLKTDKDESGAYLIERNPNYFAPVLDFLRHGELIMDAHVAEEGVLKEAEFFGLPDLISLVKMKIQEKLKDRLVELKMVEELRLETKLRLEEQLGQQKTQPPEKPKVRRSVRSFGDSSLMLDDMESYISMMDRGGYEVDRVITIPPSRGTIVIMSNQDPPILRL